MLSGFQTNIEIDTHNDGTQASIKNGLVGELITLFPK